MNIFVFSVHPSVSADNSLVGLGQVDGEGDEVDGGVAIEAVLAQLGLENLTETFQKEQIDLESLVSIRLEIVLSSFMRNNYSNKRHI